MDMKSFIVTGASASGKTALVNEAIKKGFVHLPTHTTRTPRFGEIAGIHNEYVSMDEFKYNFDNGMYFEPSLRYAEKNGVYYGTPHSWIDCLKGENYCATPITPIIAGMICNQVDVLWVSLICDDAVRRMRLVSRGIPTEEIDARMDTFKEQCDLPPQTMLFDTTFLSPSDIFEIIKAIGGA